MTTKTDVSLSLKRRIRRFYLMLDERDFEACFEMIDPRVRRKPTSVTLFQYQTALAQFMDHVGSITINKIEVNLHSNEPSTLYENRDFALGKSEWTDDNGDRRLFIERWVREGRFWYTRSTGLVTPANGFAEKGAKTVPLRKARERLQGKSNGQRKNAKAKRA